MTVPIVRPGRLGPAAAGRILARARAQQPAYPFVGALLDADPPAPDLAAERELGREPETFERAVACFRSLGPARAVATAGRALTLGQALAEAEALLTLNRDSDGNATS